MMDRRRFVVGTLACGCTFAVPRALAAEEADFICATVDPVHGPDELEGLELFGDDGTQLHYDDLASTLKADGLSLYGTASIADTWRKSDGLTPNTGKITLGVRFVDGTDAQRQAVRTFASKWLQGKLGQVIAFKFDVAPKDSQIAVTFATGQNLSKVGRISRLSAQVAPTLELSEAAERHICHEFGHALGLKHEHSNPSAPIVWNEQKVISDMAQQGWNPAMVKSNIFNKLGPQYACVGDPTFNPASIMLYPIQKSWTLNGFSAGLNSTISDRDRKCVTALYGV